MLLGLTGKSGCGKNYVGLELQRRGFEVWDLDVCAKRIRERESAKVAQVLGTTDPSEIAAVVFSNKEKLNQLEAIIYPELKKDILAFKGDLVINGALLYRSGLDASCRAVIYVDAPYETRLKRVKLRDKISELQFQMRDSSQNDVDFRTVQYRCPVYTILNDGKTDITVDLDRILSAL